MHLWEGRYAWDLSFEGSLMIEKELTAYSFQSSFETLQSGEKDRTSASPMSS